MKTEGVVRKVRRRRVFEHLKTMMGVGMMTGVTSTLILILYMLTKMDSLEILLVSLVFGSAVGLLSMSAMEAFYTSYVEGDR